MNYKNIFALLLFSFFITINSQAQNFDEVTIPLSQPGKKGILKIDVNKGPITVKGTNRRDVLVKYTSLGKPQKAKMEKTENGLKRLPVASIDLQISESDNKVKIESHSWKQGVVLEIEIPKEMDLNCSSYNQGDINVDNITGTLELTSYSGAITATNISGSLLADTYNGKILATFDKVHEGEPMAFSNYNGGLDLTFPADLKATFKISNHRGEVYTGFDMELEKQKIEKKEGKHSYKIQLGKWIKGKVNGGGAEFTLENHNGDIYIRKPNQK